MAQDEEPRDASPGTDEAEADDGSDGFALEQYFQDESSEEDDEQAESTTEIDEPPVESETAAVDDEELSDDFVAASERIDADTDTVDGFESGGFERVDTLDPTDDVAEESGDGSLDDFDFDVDAIGTLPTATPGDDDHDSMFGDLVDRLAVPGGDIEEDDLDQRSVGQIARLREIGVLDSGTLTLLLAPAGSETEHETCASIMTHQPPQDSNILLVWLTRQTADRFDRILAGWEYRPARLGVVCQPDSFPQHEGSPYWDGDRLSVHTIRDPADLTQVGITISKAVSDWADTPEQTIVCIDSVSELLRHNNTDRVFRFLHILEGRLSSVDATTHVHLDSREHELHTIRTLQSLFDATIELTDDGVTRID